MKQSSVISPSILSADFARLGEDTQAVLDAGADWVHFDVMDNHFVPNLTIGPMVCKALRGYGITAPIDVHLMVQPVDELVVEFARESRNKRLTLVLVPEGPTSRALWSKLEVLNVDEARWRLGRREGIPSSRHDAYIGVWSTAVASAVRPSQCQGGQTQWARRR